MKKYTIQCSVEQVNGWQAFEVEAEDAKQAIGKFLAGEGQFVDEEVEVTHIGEPEVVAVEDLNPQPKGT